MDLEHQARIAASKAAYEAGNIWLPDVDGIPLAPRETVLIYASIAMGCTVFFAVLVFGIEGLVRWLQ